MSRYLYIHPKTWGTCFGMADEMARNKNAVAGSLPSAGCAGFWQAHPGAPQRPLSHHPAGLQDLGCCAGKHKQSSWLFAQQVSRAFSSSYQVLGQEQCWPKRLAWHPGCGCPQQASRWHGCNSACPPALPWGKGKGQIGLFIWMTFCKWRNISVWHIADFSQ